MSKASKSNDMVHVAAIRKYLRAATKFISDVPFNQFAKDEEKQYAVAHAIEQAGEHVKKLSKSFRENTNDIEWKKIAGMRDCIVHNYEGIDLELLYTSVSRDSKQVIEILTEYINKNKSSYSDDLLDFTRVNKLGN
ncbi:DUF86 domain-containing protein [Gardnerella vaginalis]|uniref:Toxin-antitoxin system, antitoxin component domain protein n=1 Tax=Gardnerella vaginalis TaxID=2702 RepID=A0A2K1SUL9_GARVA|nr:HepT-like ribonuclease domain-containing protein [Gardnerella vaginalis]PNS43208.1 toxin-antitoxin system, antitoxin component domain protein [Gardnerella vaginalis]